MRAVVYLRISEDRTGREAGVTRQREDCLRRCTDRGWQLDPDQDVKADNDKEATTGRRRLGYEQMLAMVEGGHVGAVVAWQLDRLQRNKKDELRLYEACRRNNVIISVVRGPDLDFATASGRLVADQLGATARFEVELKSERQLRANEQAIAEGRWIGGRRPFGYEADGVTVRPVEAAAVAEGFERFTAGERLAAVARMWNAAGLTTGQGGQWRQDNVRLVLCNPRYAGLRARTFKPAFGRRRLEVVGKAVWPAVVSEETWRAAMEILTDPGRRNAPKSGQALLSGLGWCGVCADQQPAVQSRVHGGRTNRGVGGYRTIRCRAVVGHIAPRAEPIEDYVAGLVVERLSRADAVELLAAPARADVKTLRAEATRLRTKLGRLAGDWAADTITDSQLETMTRETRRRLAEAETRLLEAGRADVLGALINATDVQAAWDGLGAHGTDRQRAVVDALMTVTILPPGRGTRTFRPEAVRVRWRRRG